MDQIGISFSHVWDDSPNFIHQESIMFTYQSIEYVAGPHLGVQFPLSVEILYNERYLPTCGGCDHGIP